MRYNTVYDDIDFDYPQCGGYTVKQSPDGRTVIIDCISNYSGNLTDMRERIVYDDPIDLSDITIDDIESIRQDRRIQVVRSGYEVQ